MNMVVKWNMTVFIVVYPVPLLDSYSGYSKVALGSFYYRRPRVQMTMVRNEHGCKMEHDTSHRW